MYQAITNKFAKLLCPLDPSLCHYFLAGAKNCVISGAEQNDMTKNVIGLLLHGDRDISLVTSSLISVF
jgi:hypothetical protein